jgi:hypothetical protein
MTQRIDLYRELRHRRTRRGNGIVPAVAALVAGGILLFVHVGFEQRALRTQRAELARIRADTQRLQRVLATQPKASGAASVAEEEAQIAVLERIGARLAGGALGRTEGFSSALTALAQAATDGVWLTSVMLDNSADQLVIEGQALDAARLPVLLAALKRQPRFNGTEFAKMELARAEDAGRGTPEGTLRFRIATAQLVKGSAPQQVAAAAAGAAP